MYNCILISALPSYSPSYNNILHELFCLRLISSSKPYFSNCVGGFRHFLLVCAVPSVKKMAAKPFISEALALTEKKMDMTLDDIIKMTKNNASKPRKQRISNKSQKFASNFVQDKSARMQRLMYTKSSLRQGALAQRRSNFQANPFPLATQAAKRAAVAPIRNGPINRSLVVNKLRSTSMQRQAVNGAGFREKQLQQQTKAVPKQRSQTLDSLFANMKMQRTRVFTQKNNGPRRNGGQRIPPPWQRARFGN